MVLVLSAGRLQDYEAVERYNTSFSDQQWIDVHSLDDIAEIESEPAERHHSFCQRADISRAAPSVAFEKAEHAGR